MRMTRLAFAFVTALLPGLVLADAPPVEEDYDPEAWQARHERAARELFDLLQADASPRLQVLAGRVHLSDGDEATPLRPKGEDVVARAVNLAPGDAFVQWVAASEGNYYSSQCGPTRWPEAEVANLVRLEPDNAAAWQYAAALAQAKGDEAGVDAALERMANAHRADDHQGEEIAAWTRIFTEHPGANVSPFDQGETATPAQRALAAALLRVAYGFSGSDRALEAACTPDGSTEQSWRRLDWCARAGRVLASEGNSFALRELGLELLGNGDDNADPQRQLAWLKANASDPMQNGAAFADATDDRERDWQGAAGSILATERRMARLGKPATPPEGWTANDDAYGEGDAEAAADAWLAYMAAVGDAMRASGDVRERVLALLADRTLAADEATAAPVGDAKAPEVGVTIASIALAHPDDLLVQWVAAHHTEGDARAAAITHLQRLDPANAATWALSLPASGDKADPLPTLQRMAASRQYDEYTAGFIGIWSAAFTRVPVPQELTAQFQAMDENYDAENLPNVMALSSMFHLTMGGAWPNLLGACTPEAVAAQAERREHCLAAGRLLLQEGRTLLAARFGEALLRKLDALQGVDAGRARHVAWWQANGAPDAEATAINTYFEDWLSTGSEVEAMRLAATRAGKAEPPADWEPRQRTRNTPR